MAFFGDKDAPVCIDYADEVERVLSPLDYYDGVQGAYTDSLGSWELNGRSPSFGNAHAWTRVVFWDDAIGMSSYRDYDAHSNGWWPTF